MILSLVPPLSRRLARLIGVTGTVASLLVSGAAVAGAEPVAPGQAFVLVVPEESLANTEVVLSFDVTPDGARGAAGTARVLRVEDGEVLATVPVADDGSATASVTTSEAPADTFVVDYDGGPVVPPARSAAATVRRPAADAFTLRLEPPVTVLKRRTALVDVTLALRGAPAVRQPVLVDGEPVGRTDMAGRIAVEVRLRDNLRRIRVEMPATAGPASVSASVALTPRDHRTRLAVRGPARVVDGRSLTLIATLTSLDGGAIADARVLLQQWDGAHWAVLRGLRTDDGGQVRFTLRPRIDVGFRLHAPSGAWFRAPSAVVRRIDNVPPGVPVRLPPGAPEPRLAVPRPPRAVGEGVAARVTPIPDPVWAQMVGRSWRPGCVPRAELRLIRLNHWGFDGYRYRGELVVRDSIAAKTVAAFRAIYRARLPIRAMYRVDRFGYSSRLRGGDDFASMAADNTSGFNCRDVVGRPGVRSPHSGGRSIDINPWENPYAAGYLGWVPNRWWVGRSHPLVAWRTSSHRMVQIMRAHGFRWTYGRFDAHHFDG